MCACAQNDKTPKTVAAQRIPPLCERTQNIMRSFRNQQVAGSNPASSSTKKRLILVGIGRFSHWGGSRFLGERRAKESCQDGVNLLITKGNNNMGLEERCEALLGKQVRITF